MKPSGAAHSASSFARWSGTCAEAGVNAAGSDLCPHPRRGASVARSRLGESPAISGDLGRSGTVVAMRPRTAAALAARTSRGFQRASSAPRRSESGADGKDGRAAAREI